MAPWLGRRVVVGVGTDRRGGLLWWLGAGTETSAGRSVVLSGMCEAVITSPVQAASAPALCTQKMYHGYAELVSDSAPFGPFQIH